MFGQAERRRAEQERAKQDQKRKKAQERVADTQLEDDGIYITARKMLATWCNMSHAGWHRLYQGKVPFLSQSHELKTPTDA